jgi:triacylglycerol lipase
MLAADVTHEGLFRREARAIGRQAKLMLAAARRPPVAVRGERVAVFVHGFMAAGAVFDPLRAAVQERLGIATADFTYGPFGRFDDVVARFARHVDAVAPAGAVLSLVGHSLGGLVARAFLRDHRRGRSVDRVVTLATPHAGTTSARLLPSPLAAALRPGSDVVRDLAGYEAEVPHVAIVAGADTMCTPPASAGSLPGAEVVWIDGLGHNEMLFDPRVHDLVVRALGRSG